MIPYLIFVFLLFLICKDKIVPKQGITFLGIYLIILLALRSVDLGYIDTRYIYYESYKKMQQYTTLTNAVGDEHFRNEPLMALYIFFFSKVVSSFRLFMVVSATLSIVPILQMIKKEHNAYLALIYFFSIYYFFYTYLIKQMLALALVIYGINFARRRELFKFLIVIAVASLVHKFCWPCLIAYPLCNYVHFKKKTYIFIILLIALGITAPGVLLYLVVKIDPTHLMKTYIDLYEQNNSFNFGIILHLSVFLFCARMRTSVTENIEDYNKLLVFSAINCVLNTYSLVIAEFSRLAFFFGIYNVLLFPRAVDVLPIGKKGRKKLITGIVIMLILYGLTRTAVNTKSIPYEFFYK